MINYLDNVAELLEDSKNFEIKEECIGVTYPANEELIEFSKEPDAANLKNVHRRDYVVKIYIRHIGSLLTRIYRAYNVDAIDCSEALADSVSTMQDYITTKKTLPLTWFELTKDVDRLVVKKLDKFITEMKDKNMDLNYRNKAVDPDSVGF